MSNAILIIGESGTGKSTSIRNLDPKETFIINVLDKPLPFKGFKQNYTKFSKDDLSGNYYSSDDYNMIIRAINYVDKNKPEIKNLIIDDWQYIMANEFMRRFSERGYDKFTQIGHNGWSTINEVTKCREDLNCFIISHSETGDNGKSKIKTIGKMVDEKITLEGMFTTVLHSIVIDGKYKFLTQIDGSHTAKSPMGMFEDKYIDNDLLLINELTKKYYNENIETKECENETI